MILNIFSIFLGGGIGAVARYLTGYYYVRYFHVGFPVSTLFINVVGSFILGLCAGYCFNNSQIPESLRCAVMVGFCGGFTTFSTFSVEIVEMLKRGEYINSILYAVLSVCLSVLVAGLGFYWTKNYGC